MRQIFRLLAPRLTTGLITTLGSALIGGLFGFSPPVIASEPTTAICSSNATANRNCRPAAGSPDENMPTLALPGNRVQVNKQLSLGEQQPAWQANACQAQYRISYSQRYDKVVVDLTVDNPTCAVSQGQYRLKMRWRDADGVSQVATHAEQWQREAKQETLTPITAQHSYPINPEHQLQWVKVATRPKTACTCTGGSAPYPP